MKPLLEILILATAIGIANFMLNPNVPAFERHELSVEQLETLKTEILFVDSRNAEEYARGHIADAVNLSEGEFNTQIDAFFEAWTPDLTIVVYCNPQNCNSSRSVAKRLRDEYEIDKVYTLKGDWKKWNSSK